MAGRYCLLIKIHDMHKNHNFKYVDDLIVAIRSILSKNRCSFSEEEKNHLSNAIRYMETSKEAGKKCQINWSLVFRGIDLLNKVFIDSGDFKNFF